MVHDFERHSLSDRIDLVCDAFERELTDGENPRIEDFQKDWNETERSELLRQLLRIEHEFRRSQGETPSEDDFGSRFPDQTQIIREVFAEPGVIDDTATLMRGQSPNERSYCMGRVVLRR